jgi:hypothetical protein
MEDCEYEFEKCNSCDKAKECDKVEIWNSYHNGPKVMRRGTFNLVYNALSNEDEEDYDI